MTCLVVRLVIASALAPATLTLAATPRAAVCRIEVAEQGGQAFGSGTLIDARGKYGLVVTNWHVVRDASGPVTVRFPSGFRSEARVVKLDETWDLAALVVWRPPTEPAPLAAGPPRAGERLTICGYGQGVYREAAGRCTDYYAPEVGQPMELVELSVEARQGDSGGPILNERGEVAGVLFGAGQGVTLGSYGGRVRGFLASLAPDIGLSKPPRALARNEPAKPPERASAPATKDPFLLAERQPPGTAPQHEVVKRAWPEVARGDAAIVPRPRTEPSQDWRSVPYGAWTVAARQPAHQAAVAGPGPMASRPGTRESPVVGAADPMEDNALDWDAERNALGMIAGIAAVAVLLSRAFA